MAVASTALDREKKAVFQVPQKILRRKKKCRDLFCSKPSSPRRARTLAAANKHSVFHKHAQLRTLPQKLKCQKQVL